MVIRKQISITSDTVEDLKHISNLTGLSDSKIIRVAIRHLREYMANRVGIAVETAYAEITNDLHKITK